MNKTIYIRDEDLPVWDRARELAGDRLSPVIVDSLKRYIAEQGQLARGFERIVLEFEDASDGRLRRTAFVGRWIFSPKDPLRARDTSVNAALLPGTEIYWVAETAKGAIAVIHGREKSLGERLMVTVDLGEGVDKANSPSRRMTLAVFDSLRAMPRDLKWLSKNIEKKRGVPIEELDI